MHCVVTGVAGFIGSNLAETLLQQGHSVVGLDCFIDYYPRTIKEKNLARARSFDNFAFYEVNLLDDSLPKILSGAEWIFHQAAQAGVRASWGKTFSTYTENNIQATQRLLELARGENIKESLKKIVYASSSSVYGHAETLPTFETLRPQPISPYGVTKLAAEHLMVLYTKEFLVPTTSLRYFTVYGPRQRPDMAFHRFISAVLNGDKIRVFGDGTQTRDFTFIKDIVAANIAAANYQGKELVFNIGGGSRVSVNEVISMIGRLSDKTPNIEYLSREPGDAKHTSADTTLARRELHYSPEVKLEQGIAAHIKWFLEP